MPTPCSSPPLRPGVLRSRAVGLLIFCFGRGSSSWAAPTASSTSWLSSASTSSGAWSRARCSRLRCPPSSVPSCTHMPPAHLFRFASSAQRTWCASSRTQPGPCTSSRCSRIMTNTIDTSKRGSSKHSWCLCTRGRYTSSCLLPV